MFSKKSDEGELEEDEVEIEKDDDELDDDLAAELEKVGINDANYVGEELTDADEQNEDNNSMSKEMDSALAQAWLNGDDEAFDQIIHLIMNENVNIDYQHSDTKMTSLIVASARGNLTLTEQLIELGAKLHIRDPNNNRDALDWANHFSQNHVVDYLKGS